MADLARRQTQLGSELGHPDVRDVGRQLPVVHTLGQLLEHGIDQGPGPAAPGVVVAGDPRTEDPGAADAGVPVADNGADDAAVLSGHPDGGGPVGLDVAELRGDAVAGVAEHGGAPVGVRLLGRDQVQHLVQLLGARRA